MQPHFPADVQHLMPRQALLHDDALQLPPPEDPPDPLEELGGGAAIVAHDPPWQVWPVCEQSLQAVPPVPHAESSIPDWQLLVVSQQPPQDAVQLPPFGVPLEPLPPGLPLLFGAPLLLGVALLVGGGAL